MLSNLLFVDDTLNFCAANVEQMWYLIGYLFLFFVVSGISSLKINSGKSKIVLVGGVKCRSIGGYFGL